MADETTSTTGDVTPSTTPPPGVMPEVTSPAGPQTPSGAGLTHAETLAENEKLKAALKEANKESAGRRKQLEAFEPADAARKQAEMTDLQKAQAESEQVKAKLAKAESELRIHNRREAFRLESEKQKIQWASAQAEADAFSLSGAAESAEEPDMPALVKETAQKRDYLLARAEGQAAGESNAARRNNGKVGPTEEEQRELAVQYGVNPKYMSKRN